MKGRPLGLRPIVVPEGFPGRIDFVKSAAHNKDAPSSQLPEVAVCGRSNVGKSSLLNVLCNRRQMARVSRTPGRTRLINFFRIQDLLMFVDLPGYGYARGPIAEKAQWGQTIQGYLVDRQQLTMTLLLVDARRLPEREEQELLLWFRQTGRPCLGIMTKADKVARNDLEHRRRKTADLLFMESQDVIAFSTLSRIGRESIWGTILAACGVDPNKAATADGEPASPPGGTPPDEDTGEPQR